MTAMRTGAASTMAAAAPGAHLGSKGLQAGGHLPVTDTGDEVDPVETAQAGDLGHQLAGQLYAGHRIPVDGGYPFLRHVDLRDLGGPLPGPGAARRDQHPGVDLAGEVHTVTPGGQHGEPIGGLDKQQVSFALPGRQGGQPAGDGHLRADPRLLKRREESDLAHHRPDGQLPAAGPGGRAVAIDQQELVNPVGRRGEEIPAQPEQVAVAGVEAGHPRPPIRSTSWATATLETVARPRWLSGTKKAVATLLITPIWWRTRIRSGRVGGCISQITSKPDRPMSESLTTPPGGLPE